MIKVAAVIWIMLGTVLAGVAMTVILAVPSLIDRGAFLIPIACGAAFAAGLPIAYVVARMIADASARPV